MAYFETFLENRNNKIEALKEQMSKLDEINEIEENNSENNMVQTKLFAFLLKWIIISLP